jgi:hypothetical protein
MSGTEGFDPDDMEELQGIFAEMIADNEDGYIMEFAISKLAAKELVRLWKEASMGVKQAQNISWTEYSKIIAELRKALEEDY